METNVIVAVDSKMGIAKDGTIPWHYPEDMKFLRRTTTEHKGTAIIMGRKTWETIPPKFRPLKNRVNIVLSKTWTEMEDNDDNDNDSVKLFSSLESSLSYCKKNEDITHVFIFGGAQIYDEYMKYYTPDNIYLTQIKKDYECDTFFNFNKDEYEESEMIGFSGSELEFHKLTPLTNTEELAYLDLFQKVLNDGDHRGDRTGTGTISLFGERLTFSLKNNTLPVLTTKRTAIKMISKELLWFISGSTNTKLLEEQGVMIWKGNTSKEFLESRGLPYEEGDLGPGYGFQWRHAGAEYKGMDHDYTNQGVDQLKGMIKSLKEKPTDRRILMSAWGVSDLEKMALPPCHMMLQLYVRDGKYLSAQMYQRSADSFLGVTFNIASYALLVHILAQITGLEAEKLTMVFGDYHIYSNHVDVVKTQLSREPYPFPKIKFNRNLLDTNIDDVTMDDFTVTDYKFHPSLKAKMAI